jgi:hypothetical protein
LAFVFGKALYQFSAPSSRTIPLFYGLAALANDFAGIAGNALMIVEAPHATTLAFFIHVGVIPRITRSRYAN